MAAPEVRRLLAVLALLGLGAVAVPALLPGGDALLLRLDAVPPALWALGAAGMLASYGIRARRLQDEWPDRGLGGWQALRIVLLHNASVVTLPFRAGEASYPLLLQRRLGIGLGDAAASLLWMRLQDAAVLALLAVLWSLPGVAPGTRVAAAVLAVLALAWAVRRWAHAGAWVPPGGARVEARVEAGAARAAATGVRAAVAAGAAGLAGTADAACAAGRSGWRARAGAVPAALRRAGRRASRRGWLWSLCNWLAKAAALGTLLAAMLGAPWVAAVRAALLGEASGALPLHVPAGFGAYEAAVWLGLQGTPGLPPGAQVLAAALAVHVFALAVGLLAAAAALACEWPARAARMAE